MGSAPAPLDQSTPPNHAPTSLHPPSHPCSGGWSNPGGCERSEGARLHRRPDQRVLCPAAAAAAAAGSTAVQATTSAAIPATATVPATAATTAAIPAAASSPGSTTPATTTATTAPEIKGSIQSFC